MTPTEKWRELEAVAQRKKELEEKVDSTETAPVVNAAALVGILALAIGTSSDDDG